jgi:hypothetical protein
MPSSQSLTESRLPIEVYFGDRMLDAGIATIPKIFFRFYRYLVSDGERLNDRQAMILTLVFALRQEQEFELRSSNLPTACDTPRIERDKGLLRQMGLLFTSRLYYPRRGKRPPVLRAQRWDFRSLYYNLDLVHQAWLMGQQGLRAEWDAGKRKGARPVYVFPAGYQHEVVLPPDVAVDILDKKFFPIPRKWLNAARHTVAAGDVSQELPTLQNLQGRQLATVQNLHGHLLVVDVVQEQEKKPATVETPANLQPVLALYQQAGHELRPDALVRFQLMAQECDEAARVYDSTGADWLLMAMRRGLGVADDLLAYTAGVLRNWIAHGPDTNSRPKRNRQRSLDDPQRTDTKAVSTTAQRDWDSD